MSPSNHPESALNQVVRADFYTRRFGPYESTHIRRFENRNPGRLCEIRRKNRLKQFQIENDSRKGGTIPGDLHHKPAHPPSFTNSTGDLRLFFGGGVPAVTHLLFTMTVIRLIGVPAPSDGGSQAPTSPFTTRQRPTFHPNASPSNQVFPGKETIIVTRSRPGLVSDASRARSPWPLFQQKSVSSAKWMEFPRYAEAYRNRPPAHRHSQTLCHNRTLCKKPPAPTNLT